MLPSHRVSSRRDDSNPTAGGREVFLKTFRPKNAVTAEGWGWPVGTGVLWGLSYFFWRRLQGAAIDIHEGEAIDANAFKALIRAAVALNTSGGKKSTKRR